MHLPRTNLVNEFRTFPAAAEVHFFMYRNFDLVGRQVAVGAFASCIS